MSFYWDCYYKVKGKDITINGNEIRYRSFDMMIDNPRIKNTIVPNFSVDDSVNKGWKSRKKITLSLS